MPFTLMMPKLSPTMEEGTIVKWHKKEGDQVSVNDLLLEVATDKATVEHAALDEGWLRKILISEGEEAKVNQPIAIFTAEQNESIDGYRLEVVQPKVEVSRAEFEAKEKKDAPAEIKGITGSISQPAFVPEPPLEHYEFEGVTENSNRILASPLARKLAKERGLDLTTVKGTGPNRRIMSRDLERAQSSGVVAFGKRVQPTQKPGSYHEEPLTPMRKVISQRLQDAKTFIPHIYVEQSVNVMPLSQIREQLRNVDVKLTFNDFVIKACALALVEHPQVNSGFNSANQTIIRFETIDISVAVSVPGGLITPIVRHVNYKNLGEISLEVRQLAKRAKEGKLDVSEYKGGSFTVSNLGMYGITAFKAIINPPQAAILAVSGIQNVPVVQNGTVVPGKIMNICLSADHRVVDGVAAAEFVKTVQKYLENPASLLF
ncbi:pyruvate dehydrogenase complex dihydrolipoamide acetyltransferase [Parachlamydia sp. AcF125]|uniref:pyruvate dehydrogenase complex dihydrolipoamide acetyltransferase n=1 Tax=Parachlamydia sp. AcF125 TaxID=2795736 RepID=UPI001BC99DCF|nr:pyruvate dehydrogenase complex dihydrolipoamide acetyltransferase [Parachlamydia sp. AcF125]MBS4168869.1 Dihydrolipoyllysine-residue acetyltransferase component of pyruvate dehydrogenase complex [Parachlamydia sp. AcF125]